MVEEKLEELNLTSKRLDFLAKMVTDKHMKGTKKDICKRLAGVSYTGYTEEFVDNMIERGCIICNGTGDYHVKKFKTLELITNLKDFGNMEKIFFELGFPIYDPRLYKAEILEYLKRHM